MIYDSVLTVLLIAAFVMTGYALGRHHQQEQQLEQGPVELREF